MNKQFKISKKMSGFTMVEIMIVLAILGILTTVALPAYQDSRLRANRADGKTALLRESATQESIYSTTNAYLVVNTGVLTPDQQYLITVAACGTAASELITNCFLATATPQGAQANDSCGNLTLSSTGVRGSSSGVALDCWRR